MATLFYGSPADTALAALPKASVHAVITSPPYWLHRVCSGPAPTWGDGCIGHLGSEADPRIYANHIAEVFQAVRRVLRPDGTVWLVLGDNFMSRTGRRTGIGEHRTGIQGAKMQVVEGYGDSVGVDRPAPSTIGLRHKSLVGVPWMVANALAADGWIVRAEVVWHSRGKMPSRATDRPLVEHETMFLLSSARHYYFDQASLPAGFRRTVWSVSVSRARQTGHHAVMPEKLVVPMIVASCPVAGVVLDPFCGTGTVGVVAQRLGREFIGIDIDERWLAVAKQRLGV